MRFAKKFGGWWALALVLFFAAGASAQQGPGGIPIYFYNGASRVDLVVEADELAVLAPKGQRLDISAIASVTPGARRATSPGGHIVVQYASSVDRAELATRANVLRGTGGEIAAVAFAPNSSTTPERRVFIPNRFSLRPREGESIDVLLREFGLRVVRQVEFAERTYVVETQSLALLAGLEAANAIFESGRADFATPLVMRQQTPRFVPNDTFFSNQWHLLNTGQSFGGVAGNDVNITGAWNFVTGNGVNIALTDSGVQWAHEDLVAHARTDIDIDINGGDSDPTPLFSSHGTSVAGIAAAVGNNALGVTGAAFNAGIVGIRLIEAATSDLDEADALGYGANETNPNDYIHINSNSWGPSDSGNVLETHGPLTGAAIVNGVTNGRGGKGTIYVWAAGNGRTSLDNVNYDGYASSRYTIAVGASGANGLFSSYSEPGASMLVNAPSSYSGAGTTTTTFMGGGSLGANYTSSFGGTSSAAPLAAGVVALLLEANPNLTWRDVQHILVESATRNDPTNAAWVANGSGRLFNHNYGFGRVNAGAALTLAQGWTPLAAELPPLTGLQTPNAAVPDNNSLGVASAILVSGAPADFAIEAVNVTFTANHPRRGDLEVTLTAPSGMVSRLAELHNDSGANYSAWKFTSVAHWGEDPNGTWTLRVRDLAAGNVGTFSSWSLSIHGYPAINLTDSDGDSLPDIYETDTGVFVNGTDTGSDPNDPDSDDDGVNDGVEVSLGYDPNNPLSFPVLQIGWVLSLFALCAAGTVTIRTMRVQADR